MKQRLGARGFSLVEVVLALLVIFLGAGSAFGVLIYSRRAVIDIHARTEWRLAQMRIDAVLSDVLLCENTNLVQPGLPERIRINDALASSDPIKVADLTSLEYYYALPDLTKKRTLAKVGEGNTVIVSAIEVYQSLPPAGRYVGPSGERKTALASVVIKGKLLNSTDDRFRQEHILNFDIDTTAPAPAPPLPPPIQYYATSCYSGQSRRRSCEQLGMNYLPTVGTHICNP